MRTRLLPLFCGLLAANASAQTAATYNGGGTFGVWGGAVGWRFTVTGLTAVDSLGVFDESGNGLGQPHNVGLFRLSNLSLVASTLVPAGTAAPLVDGNRFAPISQVLLQPATEYYLLTDNVASADRYVYGTTAVSFSPGITWLGYVDTPNNSIFAAPTTYSSGQPGNLGPNFRVVPGPAAAAPLLIAGALIAHRRRAPRQAQRAGSESSPGSKYGSRAARDRQRSTPAHAGPPFTSTLARHGGSITGRHF